MNEKEETNCAQCDCDECECANLASPEMASLDEVRAKLKELQDLVRRCDGRVILSAIVENKNGCEQHMNASDCALASTGSSPSGIRWAAAFGYFIKANDCFDGSGEDIGNGVRFMFEHENKNKEERGKSLLAALLAMKS